MMARNLSTTAFFLLLPLLLITTTTSSSSSVSATTDRNSDSFAELQEFDTMIEVLRSHGYNLFSNAISTSDLQYQLLSSTATNAAAAAAFTIFAPKDSHLYSLDMDSDASAYVSTLRYHVSPNRRLTIFDLRNLTSPFLDTLLPHYSLLVSSNKARRETGTVLMNNNDHNNKKMDLVQVDGVSISDPDLYVGSRIVAHGLDGILVTGLVKNEDLLGEKRLGSDSAPDAPPPQPEVQEEEAVQVPPPVVNVSVEVAPPMRSPVAAEAGKGSKTKKRGKNHHHQHHRRSRSHRRQSRIGDHREYDL